MADDIKRLNYFTNQFLEQTDFQAEQSYHRRMRQLHNQRLHTPGVAYGLAVSKKGDREVTIAEGLAIDADGREIVVLEGGLSYTLTTTELNKSIYLSVAASDVDVDPYKGVGFTDRFTRKAERPKLLETAAFTPTAIVLATLRLDATGKIADVNTAPVERRIVTAAIAPSAITLDQLSPSIRPVSVDGVSNPGGNIDLIPTNAITLTPNNTSKTIAIGESHSAVQGNPHGTTAVQVGALPITGGTLTGGDLILKATADDAGDLVFQDSANRPKGRIWSSPTAGVSGLFISSGDVNPDITIDKDGNVGIGNPTPIAPLHILGGNWNPNASEGDLRFGDATHKLKIGIALGGGGAGDVRIRAQGGTNRLMIGGGTNDALWIQNNDTTIPTGQLSFGAQTRQMIRLWGDVYGIGVQGLTQYFRTDENFAWYKDGTHNDDAMNPGGGVRLMALNGAGDLILSARTNPSGGAGSRCRALVDLGNQLSINHGDDFSNGIVLNNGQVSVVGAVVTAIQFRGTLVGAKVGYVVDQFINNLGETLEEGDVVVLGDNQTSLYYGDKNDVPIPEVDLTETAYDTKACGIVCQVYAEMQTENGEDTGELTTIKTFTPEEQAERDVTQVQPGQIGTMVTLGTYAYCKVDADIAPIKIGDLLTTSPTKGHAQKVLDRPAAIGAIIGKALGALASGKGKIPVMVTLQ